ncbi:hypothetical protein HPB47_004811 [Ixodes persulcatus]|uniref:Uncharacterized protein n=1 Tax=Ixodes persulcatus TaxID=34615 RepID=A0AC60PEL5_IXOPE|nr:hypothetical protein HPB47_004811 [Ixodes persulcatus]
MLRLGVYADKHHQSFAPNNIIHHVEMRLLFRAPMGGANDQRLEKVHGETRGVRFDHDGFAEVAGHGWTKFKNPNPPVHLPRL